MYKYISIYIYTYKITTGYELLWSLLISETLGWLKGSKYGCRFRIKLLSSSIYILNATIILIFTLTIFGKDHSIEIILRELSTELDTCKSVIIEREEIKLSLPMILDCIILAKSESKKKKESL